MSDALSFADIEGLRAELLPARTVMSAFGYTGDGDNGGNGGEGGDNNKGGPANGGNGGTGGDGGPANAEVHGNFNIGYENYAEVKQENFATAIGGSGGSADGGDGGTGGASGFGGDGARGGDDITK